MNVKDFKKAFEYAKNRMNSKKKELNRINVFPVADGDTGTNISHTISYAIDTIKKFTDEVDFFKQVEKNVLIGARGNSGSLFSQLIKELSKSIADNSPVVSSLKLFEAFSEANRKMRKILEDPKEGTIITVIKMANEAVSSLKIKDLTPVEFFDAYTKEAKKALQKTPDFLEVLKKNNVVDSGAKGFVYFVESIAMALRNEEEEFFEEGDMIEDFHDYENLTFRFCTEFALKGGDIDRKKLKEHVRSTGDSLIFIEDDDVVKVHIHTDEPDELFEYAKSFGDIIFTKKEDMLKQVVQNQKVQIAVVGLPEEYRNIFETVGLFNFYEINSLEGVNLERTLFLPASKEALSHVSTLGVTHLETSSPVEVLFAQNGRVMDVELDELRQAMDNSFKGSSVAFKYDDMNSLKKNLIKDLSSSNVAFVRIFFSKFLTKAEKENIQAMFSDIEMLFTCVEGSSIPLYVVAELE